MIDKIVIGKVKYKIGKITKIRKNVFVCEGRNKKKSVVFLSIDNGKNWKYIVKGVKIK